MKAWMRVLEVTLRSRMLNKELRFGTNWSTGQDDLNISVTGNKYMSMLKDACTVKISNLTYSEVVRIISGKFYDIEVRCGYRHGNVQTIFKGGVLYVSNSIDSRKTNTIIILCASDMVAKFGQSRMNLTLNSGINLFSAIKFVCRRAGIQNTTISEQFKKEFLQDIMNVDDTAGSWIEKLASSKPSLISNSDSISESTLSLFDANRSNLRIITLSADTIDLSGGYPRLTNDGLIITLMPTFAFMCGDVIKLDNSIIDISAGSTSEVTKNHGYFLDKDGTYMIYEMSYRLQNRGSEFSVELKCKSRNLVSNFIGG